MLYWNLRKSSANRYTSCNNTPPPPKKRKKRIPNGCKDGTHCHEVALLVYDVLIAYHGYITFYPCTDSNTTFSDTCSPDRFRINIL